MIRHFLFLVVLACLATSVAGQEKGEDRPVTEADYPLLASDAESAGTPIDTTLGDFHRYIPGRNWGMQATGGIGLAYRAMLYEADTAAFDWGFGRYGTWFSEDRDIGYLKLKRPYTHALFGAGANNEQYLEAVHAQRIRDGWHAKLGLTLFGGDGFYTRQKTGYSNVVFGMDYVSPNKRYAAWGNVIYNKLTNQENGGIQDIAAFEAPATENRIGLTSNLLEASSEFGSFAVNYHQRWRPGERSKPKDSLTVDSILPIQPKKTRFEVQHDISFSQLRSHYSDVSPDTGYTFYRSLFAVGDSSIVFDSLHQNVLRNRIGIALDPGNARGWKPVLEIQHGLMGHWQNSFDTVYQQIEAGGRLARRQMDSSGIGAAVWGHYMVAGYGAGGYRGGFQLSKKSAQRALWQLTGSVTEILPQLVYQRYQTDSFGWNHDRVRNQIIRGTLKRSDSERKYRVGIRYTQQSRLAYFDSSGMPQQAGSSHQLLQAWVQKELSWRALNWKAMGAYQRVLSGNEIRVPEFMVTSSLWVEKKIFQGKMLSQLGGDVFYHTAYTAPGYLPLTRQFYNQNTYQVGEYPYIDVFAAFKVQRVRVFLKMAHAFEGLVGYNYSLVPENPQPGRSFRFGLQWIFFD